MQISETLLASDLEFDPPCKMKESSEEVVGGSSGRLGIVVPRSGWCEGLSKMAARTHFMWESAEPLRMHEREGGGAQEGCLESPRNAALAEGSPALC